VPRFSDAVIDDLFTYHAPTGDKPARYEELRAAARVFTKVLVKVTPESADLASAVRHVREAVMTANAAIALDGKG
jgi:hypothetical protein